MLIPHAFGDLGSPEAPLPSLEHDWAPHFGAFWGSDFDFPLTCKTT